MQLKNICQHNKFGYCKYRETCRKHHFKTICKAESCESIKCPKRHPRPCKYFNIFRRCKFGSFCLFSHETESFSSLRNDEEMKGKLNYLEEYTQKLEDKIKIGDSKLKVMEEKIEVIENKLESVLESTKAVITIAVKKAMDDVTSIIVKQQDALEEKQKENFDLLKQRLLHKLILHNLVLMLIVSHSILPSC